MFSAEMIFQANKFRPKNFSAEKKFGRKMFQPIKFSTEKKIDRKIVRPKVFSAEKITFLKHSNSDLFFLRFFDMLMIISMVPVHKSYLRCENLSLTSILRSNLGCDRLPSEFSKNDPFSRESALDDVKCALPRKRIIFLKTRWGAYRSLLFCLKSKSVRNFSIEDRVHDPDSLK